MSDAAPRLDAATRARAVDFLAAELPYHLHARLLAALVAEALGDSVDGGRAYDRATGLARQLLLRGGFATEGDALDPWWDAVMLDGARARLRAARY